MPIPSSSSSFFLHQSLGNPKSSSTLNSVAPPNRRWCCHGLRTMSTRFLSLSLFLLEPKFFGSPQNRTQNRAFLPSNPATPPSVPYQT
ncbi:hypothetical protein COLO4_32918 [Corchorus olitorius]|uniref:Uncharacterized protein n=1 Tax=Corchorus olitorius TaxID=93759 RepID=A0A1R3GXA8_9ROSI|nr:hypothetical protein COLO4_32918 [Corchorus olitorius]